MCDCGLEQKIKARIKELEDSPAPKWVGRWEILDAKMEELQDLLLLTASTQVISFETETDRSKGFSLLMASGLSFNGLGKNKFVVTLEQSLLLQTNKINYKRLDYDYDLSQQTSSSSQGDIRA